MQQQGDICLTQLKSLKYVFHNSFAVITWMSGGELNQLKQCFVCNSESSNATVMYLPEQLL